MSSRLYIYSSSVLRYTMCMHKHLPTILLGLELLTLLFIILSGPFVPSDPIMIITQLFALGLVGWGSYALQKQGTFSVFPELPKNASLVTSGPYEIIRHPMYSGILLFALVSIINYTTLPRLLALLVLVLIILYKVHLEEEYLEKKFGEYEHYRHKTKRLIPYLY
jgi:protein-S-isoprenylcysteine O-methyltransferase Ste14